MEILALTLAAYILLAPGIAWAIASKARRRQRELESTVGHLERRLQACERQHRSPPPPTEHPPASPETSPASPEPAAAPGPGTRPAAAPPQSPLLWPPPQPVRPATETGFFGPPAATTPPAEADPPPAQPAPWIKSLRAVGLWPPAAKLEEDGQEVALMQWWLPRLGGFLALLTALFFAVYINLRVGPTLKFMQMAGASCGLAALGLFLERRHRAFGGVLFVTGLVMLYLCSVAAYTLPAVRIITNPWVGALLQAGVLAGMVAVGLQRRSHTLVILTFGFGLFLTLFMAWTGLREGALVAAGLLVVSGACLARVRAIDGLSWILVPGAFFVPLAHVLAFGRYPLQPPESLSVLIFLQVMAAWWPIHRLLDGGAGLSDRADRWLTATHTSLAIFSGVAYFRLLVPGSLSTLLLVSGLVFLFCAAALWMRQRVAYHSLLFFVKASFLLSSFVITEFAGDLRWSTLALQALTLAFIARWSRSRWTEATALLTLAAGLWLQLSFISAQGFPPRLTFTWWLYALHPILSLLTLAWMAPLSTAQAGGKPGSGPGPGGIGGFAGTALYTLAAAGLSVLAFRLSEATAPPQWEVSLVMIAFAWCGAALALWPRLGQGIPATFSLLCFLAAAVSLWERPLSDLALFLTAIWAVTAATVAARRSTGRAAAVLELVIWVALIPALASRWMLWTGEAPIQTIGLLFAAGFTWILSHAPWFRQLGFLALLFPIVGLLAGGPSLNPLWAWLTMLTGLGLLLLPFGGPWRAQNRAWLLGPGRVWPWAGGVVLWAMLTKFQWGAGSWIGWLLLLVAGAGVLFLYGRQMRKAGFWLGAALFTLTALLFHLTASIPGWMTPFGTGRASPWAWEVLASAAALSLILLGWSFLGHRLRDRGPGCPISVTRVRALGALTLFLVWASTFLFPALGWKAVYTPLLAAVLFAIILLGLILDDRAYRRVGMALLLVPLVRLFAVDVQDALYRIAAFGVLAVCLTVLGYGYHRLERHRQKRAEHDGNG